MVRDRFELLSCAVAFDCNRLSSLLLLGKDLQEGLSNALHL